MTIKQIDTILEEGNSLKQIAQAYSEIANLKIKRIRGEVERNRVFFEEISQVFGLIKRLAVKQKISIIKPKKTISLILTSNQHFSGSINADLIDFYILNTQKIATDRIILGKAAIEYFKTTKIFNNYQEILLAKDQPDSKELINLVNIIRNYNQVLVIYSSMKSLLVQIPCIADITASSAEDPRNNPGLDKDKPGLNNSGDLKFIFEPELSKILQFFDSQIITLLLEGTFLESELSRTAARFISMDSAETEANKFIKEYEKDKAYVKRNLNNNTILENFASMAAVRKEGSSLSS